jgi:chromosome segregation ATPase
MRKLQCFFAIALLLVTALVFKADRPWAATEPSTVRTAAPARPVGTNPALPTEAAPVPVGPAPAGPAKPPASEQGSKMTGAEVKAAGAAKAPEPAKAPGDPTATEMTKLKHQIKTVRLSLADTQGRLAVTEKDLSTATGENVQLRSENVNLRVGLTKAETVAKKSEEELGYRRQEVKTLQSLRPLPSGSGGLTVGLVLALLVAGILAVLLFGQGEKLRGILKRTGDGKGDEKRQDQLRSQLQSQLKEEQQRSQRLDEEIKEMRALAESQANAPAGSRREKLDALKRELSEARAAAESDRHQAGARIQELEAELARVTADKQQVDERIQKLEPGIARLAAAEAEKLQVDDRIQKLEAELARITADKLELDGRIQKLEPEMAQLASEKQTALARVQELEPEVERLTAEKVEAEERSKLHAHDAARLMAEKLRLQHALSKAHEKLIFLGHDEPEDTLPPVVG